MKLEIVRKYFQLTFMDKKPELAAELYLHEEYQHHDFCFTQNKIEFILFFSQFFKSHPDFWANIVMEIESEEMVVLMVKTKHQIVAEFYQLEELKIKNHWHVIQKIEAS